MPSFTTRVPNLQGAAPIVEVGPSVGSIIEEVLARERQNPPTPVQATAMIDTGATRTIVREEVVRQLGLNPVGLTFINTPSSTNVECCEYLMRILFHSRVVIETVAIAAPLQGQHIQRLIGRDVLRHGVFIYTGYDNTFTLSF